MLAVARQVRDGWVSWLSVENRRLCCRPTSPWISLITRRLCSSLCLTCRHGKSLSSVAVPCLICCDERSVCRKDKMACDETQKKSHELSCSDCLRCALIPCSFYFAPRFPLVPFLYYLHPASLLFGLGDQLQQQHLLRAAAGHTVHCGDRYLNCLWGCTESKYMPEEAKKSAFSNVPFLDK